MVKLGFFLASVLAVPFSLASSEDHRYRHGEAVELWVNKVRFFARLPVNRLRSRSNPVISSVLSRLDRMPTPKKLMNITRSHIVHRKPSITQRRSAVADGMNGRFTPLENTSVVMLCVIPATT